MEDLLFGLRTTVLGMGIVFGVLAILWVLLTLVVKLDERSARASSAAAADASGGTPAAGAAPAASADGALQPAADPAAPAVRLVAAPDDVDPRMVAAITVAILRHAEARRLQAAPAMRSYWPGSLLFASRWVAAGRTRQGQSWRRRR